ncbi:AraC family transcriptional regulator [Ideonella sp. DXS29W]|uniref:AraC family transcriptional regulator n=1 Tax=Ideonella lacteola TaxID=2984193 RepID=A0ABU9BZ50_9BURK
MSVAPRHHCHVLGSPWPGVHGTVIDSGRHYGRHWHGTFGLGRLERGAQRSASGRGEVEAVAGQLITTNPGEVHDGRPIDGAPRRWRMVYLEPAVLASMAPGAPSHTELARPVVSDPPAAHALGRLLDRLERWNAGATTAADVLACEESLVACCAAVLSRHATRAPEAVPSGPAHHRLLRVRDRLGDEMADVPDLATLAQEAGGLSRFQLLRHFQRAFGLTPYAWLLQRRAEHARGLIRQGVGLAQAAAACGFADQSHMTRTFSRHFGFTPGAWQQAVRPRPKPGG